MKGKGRWLAAALLVALAAWFFLFRERPVANPTGRVEAPDAEPVERVVPRDQRIRVEVLNGTGERGLARRGTVAMRDAGFDVVATGNWTERVDSSLVLVRTGNLEWGALAAKALRGARIEARPDSSRYVDLTIVLGARWRPPPQPFDP